MTKTRVFYCSEGTDDTPCLVGDFDDTEALKVALGEFLFADVENSGKRKFNAQITFYDMTDEQVEALPDL